MDIDLAHELGKELKAEVEFVESTFATFAADLQSDKCDIAMFGLGATLSRATAVEFSQPYLETSIYAVVMKSNPKVKTWADIDKPGHVVAVALGSYVEAFMKTYLKQAKVLAVQAPATREQEVAAGRADVMMTDYPIARKLAATMANQLEGVGVQHVARACRRIEDHELVSATLSPPHDSCRVAANPDGIGGRHDTGTGKELCVREDEVIGPLHRQNVHPLRGSLSPEVLHELIGSLQYELGGIASGPDEVPGSTAPLPP